MISQQDPIEQIDVHMGTYQVSKKLTLFRSILGSCVGIGIWEPGSGYGGLAHIMLPFYDEGKDKVTLGKYADTSIYMMVDELVDLGAEKKRLRAKQAGGANMFPAIEYLAPIGDRNIEAARSTLQQEKIQLEGEHVGGIKGRFIHFNVNGLMRVRIGEESILI